MARLSKLSYQLRTYYLGGWSLQRWAMTLALGLAALLALQWVLRGQPPTPWWHWLLPAALVLGAVTLWTLGRWSASGFYVKFDAEPDAALPAPVALSPNDKVVMRATGHFAVEDRAQDFADLQSYWRTFALREHTVMAAAPDSRFLVLGQFPEELIGMWYIFFTPEAIREVTPGRLTFGADAGPALRVRYTRTEPNANAKKPPRVIAETAYLKFADEDARNQVWGDLLVDDVSAVRALRGQLRWEGDLAALRESRNITDL